MWLHRAHVQSEPQFQHHSKYRISSLSSLFTWIFSMGEKTAYSSLLAAPSARAQTSTIRYYSALGVPLSHLVSLDRQPPPNFSTCLGLQCPIWRNRAHLLAMLPTSWRCCEEEVSWKSLQIWKLLNRDPRKRPPYCPCMNHEEVRQNYQTVPGH